MLSLYNAINGTSYDNSDDVIVTFLLSIPSLIFYTFIISMADAAHVVGSDYVGISLGNKTGDKFAKAGFTATKSQLVNALIINELAVYLECKLKSSTTKTENPKFLTMVGKINRFLHGCRLFTMEMR